MMHTRIENLATHPEPFITVKQLAMYWGVAEKTIYRGIDKGSLVVTRIGRAVRIATDDARRFGKPDEANGQ